MYVYTYINLLHVKHLVKTVRGAFQDMCEMISSGCVLHFPRTTGIHVHIYAKYASTHAPMIMHVAMIATYVRTCIVQL